MPREARAPAGVVSVSIGCVATGVLTFMLGTGGAVTSPMDSSLPSWAGILGGPDIRDAVLGAWEDKSSDERQVGL